MHKRRIYILALILSCFCIFTAASVFAASASVSVSNSSPTVGNSVSVNVSYSGAQFGAADAVISYNPDVLEFTGSNVVSGGGGGSVSISMVEMGSSTMSGTLNFKVIDSGSSDISIRTTSLSDYNINALSVNSDSAHLTAQPKSASTGNSSTNSDSSASSSKDKDKGKNKDKKEEKRDAQVTLKSLDYSCGTLSPKFSPNKYTYTLYVAKTDKECIISATPSSDKSKVKISGSSKLDGKPAKRVITVIAEDGTEGTYEINISYGDPNKLMINGTSFVGVKDPNQSDLPGGFEKTTVSYRGNKLVAFKSKDGKITLVQLKPEDNSSKGQWFRYDEKEEKFDPAEIIEIKGKKFIKIGSGYDLLYGKDGKATGYLMYDPDTGKLAYVDFDYNGSGMKGTNPVSTVLLIVVIAMLAAVLIIQFGLIRRRGLGPKKIKEPKKKAPKH